MELKYILGILDAGEPTAIARLIAKIKKQKPPVDPNAVALFDISAHDVMNPAIDKRPNRSYDVHLFHDDGRPMVNEDGSHRTETRWEIPNRIPLPLQKYIVDQRTAMILTNPVKREATAAGDAQDKLVKEIDQFWEDNKLDYDLKEVLYRQMSEVEVALLLNIEKPEEKDGGNELRIRINILKSAGGGALFPVFNQFEDMVAFGHAYELLNDETEKKQAHFDLYTPKQNYHLAKVGGFWGKTKDNTENLDGKIPVVYFYQKNGKVESADVQPVIGRKELLSSNHADSNDSTAFPTTVVKAENVISMPKRTSPAKVLQLKGDGAEAKYLETKGAPDSVKMEYENLTANMFMLSGTMNFNALHDIFGSARSEYAMKLLFMNSHMAAAKKDGDFGKGVQRLLNLAKSMICKSKNINEAKSLKLKPVFELYLPKNPKEELEIIEAAKRAGVLSDETAALSWSGTKDPKAEWERLQSEQKAREEKEKTKMLQMQSVKQKEMQAV